MFASKMGSVGVVVLQVLLICITTRAVATDMLLSDASNTSTLCSRRDPAMDPFYEIRYGQDVVWQIPPNPKAVLFLAHGMDKDPQGFFDPGPNCRQCYGLPENRVTVLSALARGYAVIMVKCVSNLWLPWSTEWPVPDSLDRKIVRNVIREWTKEHSLEQLPLVVLGISSGGNFSTILPLDLDIKSLVLMCTGGEMAVLKNAVSFPPTLFVAMPVDNLSDGFYVKALVARRILDSKGVLTKQIDVWPKPIHPFTFAEKIPCLEWATSAKIHAAYKAEGWLDEKDYVVKNPFYMDWESVLLKHKILRFCPTSHDICLAKHIQHELGAAYAYHAFTSSADVGIFDWLDDTMFLGSSDHQAESKWASQ